MRSAANPSEASIAAAIEKLKAAPGEFQRVAEDYARLSFPNLFSHLVPKGRRPDAVTIKGWPDAYAELTDGRIAALEATHSPAWPRHLHTDLTKNLPSIVKGKLAAFIFVAWAPRPPRSSLKVLGKSCWTTAYPGKHPVCIPAGTHGYAPPAAFRAHLARPARSSYPPAPLYAHRTGFLVWQARRPLELCPSA